MRNSKSILFVLLALLLTTVSACTNSAKDNSASDNSAKYEVIIPKFEKVIKINRNKVQLRKSPDKRAPELCRVCVFETDNCYLDWSDAKLEPDCARSPFLATEDEVFLVLEETPEWYGVIVEGNKAYLPKKYAKEITIKPITPEMLTQKEFYGYENEQYPGIAKGKYRGYAAIDQTGWETEGYMIGHIADGMLVLTHHISGYGSFNEKDGRLEYFKKNEYGYWEFAFGTAVAADEVSEWSGRALDFNKLSEGEFEKFLEAANVTAPYDYIVIIAHVNGGYQIIADNLNLNDIPEDMKKRINF
jgi:hypothetical protein